MYLLCIELYAQIYACSMMHCFELLHSHVGVSMSGKLIQPLIDLDEEKHIRLCLMSASWFDDLMSCPINVRTACL